MEKLELIFVVLSILTLWAGAYCYVWFVRKKAKDRCGSLYGKIVCALPAIVMAFYPLWGVEAAIISAVWVVIISAVLIEAAREYISAKAETYGFNFAKAGGYCFIWNTATALLAIISLGFSLTEYREASSVHLPIMEQWGLSTNPQIWPFLMGAFCLYSLFNIWYLNRYYKKAKKVEPAIDNAL